MRTMPEERGCRLAMLAAFLETSGFCSFGTGQDSFYFTNENEEVAEYFLLLVDRLFGVSMTVTEATRDPKHGRDKFTFSYTGERAGEFADETTDYCAVNLCGDEFFGVEGCMRDYLAGAFLGGGSCTLPRGGAKTGYHLEFVFCDENSAESFCVMLDRLQLIAHIVSRGEKFVVYSKNRETISDFLAIVGAKTALKRLEEVSAARAMNNNVNRASNCAAGNADKSAIASAAQVFAIEKMKENGTIKTLPPQLGKLAELRLRNPTLSLGELAQLEGVTKSCINHRMRKLMEIYDKTDKKS